MTNLNYFIIMLKKFILDVKKKVIRMDACYGKTSLMTYILILKIG